ncbi:MAG: glycosyltransferase family 9 protein [Bdellovibrionia bacterium]
MKSKILLIRFSSFGDVLQCLSVASKLKELIPEAEIVWLTRREMAPLIETHPAVTRVIPFDRKLGLIGLVQLAWKLRSDNFTHIYDAHNNLRSNVVSLILSFTTSSVRFFTQKNIHRFKRFLLFTFRINRFAMPFNGQRDLLEPLTRWGGDLVAPPTPQFFPSENSLKQATHLVNDFFNAIALAPSAAYPLKRWPLENWKQLVASMPNQKFILLGGPEDQFVDEIASVAPDRVLNLAGKCNFEVSAAVIALSSALVANDTGLMHVGEQLGKKTIALMGPAPFGFPSRSTTTILQRDLPCRPCSKHGQGPCKNKIFQECLATISPQEVASHLGQKS